MENKMSVDDSTQVGCEDINMSSRRERKFEDDNYDSVAVYGEDNDEDDDDWKERSYEELEELISDSENPSERKESESSPV